MSTVTFERLLEDIRTTYGYDFSGYAHSSLQRRFAYFMQTKRITEMENLRTYLLSNEDCFEEFVQELSVNVTEMFRDPGFFRSLREHVVPRLATYPFIKAWIAGCASGEEVHSLAILLKEEGLLNRTRIYATDINQQALSRAAQGIYAADDMQLYTQNYIGSGGKTEFSSYYSSNYGAVKFSEDLRQNVVFAPHNLAMDQSFNEFQLILCRNVLIYFDPQLQDRVIDLFHESLCHFGFLGLGSRESLLFKSKRPLFSDVDKKHNIFMKVE